MIGLSFQLAWGEIGVFLKKETVDPFMQPIMCQFMRTDKPLPLG